MDERDTLPLKLDEWEKNAESERAAAKRKGVALIPMFLSTNSSRSAKRRKSHPTV